MRYKQSGCLRDAIIRISSLSEVGLGKYDFLLVNYKIIASFQLLYQIYLFNYISFRPLPENQMRFPPRDIKDRLCEYRIRPCKPAPGVIMNMIHVDRFMNEA
jgi:hypothetical protein